MAEWVHHFLEDIPKWSKLVHAMCTHCDSQSTICRTQSSIYNIKLRHIRKKYNSIRQLISNGMISIDYVSLNDNIADSLIKWLNRELVGKTSK